MADIEWTKGMAKQLIQLYSTHACLWDSLSKDHKNRLKKGNAWRAISSKMGMDRYAVEKKMKSLLTQFRREKNRIRDIETVTGEPFQTKWFGYELFSFMTRESGFSNKMTKTVANNTRSRNSHLMIRRIGEPDDDVGRAKDDLDLKVESDESDQKADHFREFELQQGPVQKPIEGPLVITSKPSIPVKGTHERTDNLDMVLNIMKSVVDRAGRYTGQQHQDEYTSFGEVVASKIRKLKTDYERSVVQHRINSLLFEAEMGMYEQGNQTAPQDLIWAAAAPETSPHVVTTTTQPTKCFIAVEKDQRN